MYNADMYDWVLESESLSGRGMEILDRLNLIYGQFHFAIVDLYYHNNDMVRLAVARH